MTRARTEAGPDALSSALERRPEVFEMLRAIVNEEPVGPSFGWFHPGEMRRGWAWLADRYDKDKDGAIVSGEFTGPAVLFDRLDRDRNGAASSPTDFDWSEAIAEFVRLERRPRPRNSAGST